MNKIKFEISFQVAILGASITELYQREDNLLAIAQ